MKFFNTLIYINKFINLIFYMIFHVDLVIQKYDKDMTIVTLAK